MSPWTFIGWCIAVLAALGTLTVLLFTGAAVVAAVWAFLSDWRKGRKP